MTYDALGRLLTSTTKAVPGCDTAVDALCATDLTTTRVYTPAAGPLAREQRPGGGVTAYTYDGRGRIRTISRGPASTDLREQLEYSYDPLTGKKSLERVLAFENGSWVEKKRETYGYDSDGMLQTVTRPGNSTVTYAYDDADRIASIRDETHTQPNTFYAYDPAGRLAAVHQTLAGAPEGVITTGYAYDAHGNLHSVTDPNGNVTTYLYDDFGAMVRQESPVTGTTTFAYDEANNLTASTDARAAVTQRTYDALNRVLTASSTAGAATEAVTWTYDDPSAGRFAIGRVSSMADPAGTTAYHYDRRGMLTRESRTFSGCLMSCADPFSTSAIETRYRYDADGNRTSITYPRNALTVQYTYDHAGRPLTASDAVTSAAYAPFGPLERLTFANGTTQTFTYDSSYRLTQNALTTATTTLASYRYTYDPAGNITQLEDLLESAYDRTFGYDDLHRLVTANTGAALWRRGSYSWDAMGNPVTMKLAEVEPGESDGLARFPRDITADAQWQPRGRTSSFLYAGISPRLQTVTTNDLELPVSYDAAGNELSYVATRTYSPRNLLAEVADAVEPGETYQVKLRYAYDGRGIRVVSGTTPVTGAHLYYFYTPELRLLATATEQARSYEIVWFGDRPVSRIAPDGTRSFTFADHLGTPILETSLSATPTWRAEYEPFGNVYAMRTDPAGNEIGNRTDQPLRFPGQEVVMTREGTEENYNVYRWYRAGWGRYTQADPAEFEGGLNLYSYALANPLLRVDLDGLTSYKGFPGDKEQQLRDAVEKAKEALKKNCCDDAKDVLNRLERAEFVYVDEDKDWCGYVGPNDWLKHRIKISRTAFDPSNPCFGCPLPSIVVHESVHLRRRGMGEDSAYQRQRQCFGCPPEGPRYPK